ncbi:MAG: hypothetical protein KU29_13295 [Sulfurovum sp. FS06-10]|jgi:plasmid replication initiation protein|nr:MAG: hypothetical protein KU29_13295 [Sulfurovum sp. FS06-10]
MSFLVNNPQTRTITIKKESDLTSVYTSGELTVIQKKSLNGLIYITKEQLIENENRTSFKIDLSTLKELIGDHSTNNIQLKDNIKALQKIIVEYNILQKNKEVTWGSFPLLAGAEIKNGSVFFNFAFQVLNLIKNPQMYVILDLKILKNLSSKHSITLYEICKDWINVSQMPIWNIETFKKAMDIDPTKYINFTDFRRFVLDKAVEEINDKTDIFLSYSLFHKNKKVDILKHKRLPKVEAIQFHIKSKIEGDLSVFSSMSYREIARYVANKVYFERLETQKPLQDVDAYCTTIETLLNNDELPMSETIKKEAEENKLAIEKIKQILRENHQSNIVWDENFMVLKTQKKQNNLYGYEILGNNAIESLETLLRKDSIRDNTLPLIAKASQ